MLNSVWIREYHDLKIVFTTRVYDFWKINCTVIVLAKLSYEDVSHHISHFGESCRLDQNVILYDRSIHIWTLQKLLYNIIYF